jgi:16S rRNA (cytidine1402-2'-O)-methyltransferase
MLYLVSTPIGNIEDISFRAIKVLGECDYILAEDTRRTGKLLSYYKIKKQLVSFNDISSRRKTSFVIEDLKKGKNIALVSDAGTPGINDPGFYLVRECVINNLTVSPVPGASAFISALVCSGLPSDKFTYYGFLPKNNSKRKKILSQIKEREETAIFYESPYRIVKTVEELKIMPEKQIVIARELTKHFEEFIRGYPEQVYDLISKRSIKGEIAVIIH